MTIHVLRIGKNWNCPIGPFRENLELFSGTPCSLGTIRNGLRTHMILGKDTKHHLAAMFRFRVRWACRSWTLIITWAWSQIRRLISQEPNIAAKSCLVSFPRIICVLSPFLIVPRLQGVPEKSSKFSLKGPIGQFQFLSILKTCMVTYQKQVTVLWRGFKSSKAAQEHCVREVISPPSNMKIILKMFAGWENWLLIFGLQSTCTK